MENQVNKKKWLSIGEPATRRYVIELYDGNRGEADTALALFDLLCDPDYSDTDDRVTQIMMLGQKLKNIAAYDLAAMEIRAEVHAGVGLFFENAKPKHLDEEAEFASVTFKNDEPVVLDFWDEWTTMASMISCGYLKLYEKAHQLTEQEQAGLAPSLGVFEKMLGEPGQTEDYWEVTPNQVSQEPTWKKNYILLNQRR